MEGEEQKDEAKEETKTTKRVKLTVTKVKEISSRMLEPVVEEERARDMRQVIRAIKDPDLVTRGTKTQSPKQEKTASPQSRKRSVVEKNRESIRSLYKMPEAEIKLLNLKPESIGFVECMSKPRIPEFDETESDTTFERLSNDSESEETPSLLELLKSDRETENSDERPGKDRKGCKTAAQIANEEYEMEDILIPKSHRKKLKKWKPKIKRTGMAPDPLLTEFADGVKNYLSELGIFQFMKDWLCHLYGMNPKPKDPVKLLLKYLESTLGNAAKDSDVSQLDKELKETLKKEDDIRVEISKLNHLAHLLAPEIYDQEGNMIAPEPSFLEEHLDIEEETAQKYSSEKVEAISASMKSRKGSNKNRSTNKKLKGKSSSRDVTRVPSKSMKSNKMKKKKSVAKITLKTKSGSKE